MNLQKDWRRTVVNKRKKSNSCPMLKQKGYQQKVV